MPLSARPRDLGALATWVLLGVAIGAPGSAGAIDPIVPPPDPQASILERVRAGDARGAAELLTVGVASRRGAATPEAELDLALWLNNLAVLEFQLGDLHAASQHMDESVALRTRHLDPADPLLLQSWSNLAGLQYASGHLEEARAAYTSALDTARRTDAPAGVVAQVAAGLGTVLVRLGRPVEGLAALQESRALRADAATADDPDLLRVRREIAMALLELGRADEAADEVSAVLGAQIPRLGPEHPDVARTWLAAAIVAETRGDAPSARDALRHAIDLLKATRGDHPDTANAMVHLARLLAGTEASAESEAWLGEAAAIQDRVLPARHAERAIRWSVAATVRLGSNAPPEVVREAITQAWAALPEDALPEARLDVLTAESHVAIALGDLATAHRRATEAWALVETDLPNHRSRWTVARNLAIVRLLQGDLEGASVALDEAERAAEGLGGSVRIELDLDRARLRFTEGQLTLARRSAERALEASDALGVDPGDAARARSILALISRAQGDLTSATRLHQEALILVTGTFGPGHPRVAEASNNLAAVQHAAGDVDAAAATYRRAIDVIRGAVGPDHPVLAAIEHNLGTLEHTTRGDVAAARPLLEDALRIRQRVLGTGHPDTLATRVSLALLDVAGGDPAAGARALIEIAAHQKATLGADHPTLATTYDHLARALRARGDLVAARVASEEALRVAEARLDLLPALPERAALAYVRRVRGPWTTWLELHDRPEDDLLAYETVLRWKGVASRGLEGRDRARPGAEADATRAALDDARRALAYALFAESPDAEVLAELTEQKQAIERELASEVVLRDAPIGLAAVCDAIPRGGAIVDVVRTGTRDLAFVVDRRCAPRRFDLGSSVDVDARIEQWRRLIDRPGSVGTRVDAAGAAVRRQVWDPLTGALDRAETVWVVPDGAWAGLPLGGLPTPDGKYLTEAVDLRYLDRATALVTEGGAPARRGRGATVVAGPAYGTGTVARHCVPERFDDLPGAAAEGTTVAARWISERRDPVTLLVGADATETTVLAVSRPEVLHLATHGFYGSPTCRPDVDGTGAGYDPMLLSGLALAGANLAPRGADDGLLTAEEVGAGLDLTGTRLVVVSACASGVGATTLGEGVLGLRRALARSGAADLIVATWNVPDEDTRALMDAFYRHYLSMRRPSAGRALQAAQADRLAAQRAVGDVHVRGWAAFVVVGPGQ